MPDLPQQIPITRIALMDSEINSVLESSGSSWLAQGPKFEAFEKKWSEFTLPKHSLPLFHGMTLEEQELVISNVQSTIPSK